MAKLDMDDPSIVALRKRVKVAHEEFAGAIACHEAWKPAAYDKALHDRMGRSFATNAFLVIRLALRREMLLSLARMWDTDKRALGMVSISNTLGDGRVLDALVANYEAHWQTLDIRGLEDVPEDDRAAVAEAARRIDADYAAKQGAALRESAAKAIAIIASYAEGGSQSATLEALTKLRNERLAHRQLKESSAPGASDLDEKIEAFYQDMGKLVQLLEHCVEGKHYEPEETARLRRRHAELFWASARGERTDGHPDCKPPRSRPIGTATPA